MDTRYQELQVVADLIKDSSSLVKEKSSINEIYAFIEHINEAVSIFYRNISWKNKCFLCCQHSNIPTASTLEWEKIYEFTLKSDEQTQQDLINSTKKLFLTYGEYLKKIHFALDSNDDDYKLKELYDNLPKFKGTSCIFLKNGSCSIYDVRPGKCRTQGYALMQFQKNIQFQTCIPEIVRIEEMLGKQGNRKVLMPLWNDYEKQIYTLHKNKKLIVTVLPVWLFSHVENNSFVKEIIYEPDFEKILGEL